MDINTLGGIQYATSVTMGNYVYWFALDPTAPNVAALANGGLLIFRSDGTSIQSVANVTGIWDRSTPVVCGNRIYFAFQTLSTGTGTLDDLYYFLYSLLFSLSVLELWSTDGVTTALVRDIDVCTSTCSSQPSSNPTELFCFKSILYFQAALTPSSVRIGEGMQSI